MPNSDHPAPNATFSLPPPTLHSVMIRWIETSRGQYAETPSQVSNGWSFPDDSRNRASALAETKSAQHSQSDTRNSSCRDSDRKWQDLSKIRAQNALSRRKARDVLNQSTSEHIETAKSWQRAQWMSFEDIVKASRLQHLALLRDAAEDETLVRSMKRTSAAAALMFAVSCWVLTMDSSS